MRCSSQVKSIDPGLDSWFPPAYVFVVQVTRATTFCF